MSHLDSLELGRRLRAEGDYPRATAVLREALEDALRAAGTDSGDTVIMVLNELGITYKYCGDFAEGAKVYERALADLVTRVGETHPAVAAIYHNLGGLAHARGDYAAAEPLARRAVEIRQLCLGPDDPAVAADLAALAPILDALGRHDEAERILTAVLARYTAQNDFYEIGVTLHNLGSLAFRRSRPTEAADLLRRAAATKRRSLGPRHPELAITLYNLAVVLQSLGDEDEARALLIQAIELLSSSVRPDHPTLLSCEKRLRQLS